MRAEAPASRPVPANGRRSDWLPRLLGGLGGKRVGVEPGGLTSAAYEEWKGCLAGLADAARPVLVPMPAAIEALRAVKEPDELDALTRAVLLGDSAFTHAASVARAGMTERELAWEVHRYSMEHGADDLSFPTIIATGPWGALPHAYPRDVPLEAGAGVVMDLGVIVERSSALLNAPIDGEAAREIAHRARGTPRVANRLLRRVRDFATVETGGQEPAGPGPHGPQPPGGCPGGVWSRQ